MIIVVKYLIFYNLGVYFTLKIVVGIQNININNIIILYYCT